MPNNKYPVGRGLRACFPLQSLILIVELMEAQCIWQHRKQRRLHVYKHTYRAGSKSDFSRPEFVGTANEQSLLR